MARKTLAELCAERKAQRLKDPAPRFSERTMTLMTSLAASGFKGIVARRLIRSYYMAERNSKQRGIEFSLSISDLMLLAQRAKGKCEITGLSFEVVDTSRKWDRQPWTASIDRIDCSVGYRLDNCRLVCAAVNVALNSWGESVLERIAEGIVSQRLRHVEGYGARIKEMSEKIQRRNRYLRGKVK